MKDSVTLLSKSVWAVIFTDQIFIIMPRNSLSEGDKWQISGMREARQALYQIATLFVTHFFSRLLKTIEPAV